MALFGRSAACFFENVALVVNLFRDPDVAISANVGVATVFKSQEIELTEVFTSSHGSR